MPVAGTIICEDAADLEAESGEVSSRHEEEAHGGGVFLIGQDGGEGDAAVVVDSDVEVLVSGTSGLVCAVAMDAVAGLNDAG